MSAQKLFLDYFAKKLVPTKAENQKNVVVSPDAGGAKKAEKFAKLLGADLAILHKTRPAHNRAEIQKVVGEVAGKVALIFDDIVDTAGSVAAAADTLRANGATKVFLAATHAVLSNDAREKLAAANFAEIIFTDSIPQNFGKMKNVKVLSIADLLAKTIVGVHESRSVSKFWETHK